MVIASLRPALPITEACKICATPAPLYGVVDFNKSCEEFNGKFFPLAGIPVYYRRCPNCGFLFTSAFDDWTGEEFKAHIYNDDYIKFDPGYVESRPATISAMIARTFERDKSRLRVLDYGGGNGRFAEILRNAGFLAAQTYDPFSPAFATLPDGTFDLVTCFETLEHHPDPLAGIAALVRCTGDPGAVVFSTLVQPADFDKHRMNWWYAGPRNGHISLFSRKALALAWQRHGFVLASFNDNYHFAFRQVPDFARHLVKQAA
jgi:2-polyprenyl-6-hydroxyphenyl methylase/3-demethylubiquinone-9 3-methyltransferase